MNKGNDIHIAIIDDEQSLCRSMGRLLRAAGFNAVTFESAEEFLADEVHASFDCIVLDIQLAGISGLELHQRLVETHIETPVIFITAHDAPEVRTQAESAGCSGYFRKTDSGSAVLAAIEQAVRSHRSIKTNTQ